MVFSDVRLTNQRPAPDNALEADRCELNFATGPLLHKQAIVESGRISGLRFGPLNERGGVESTDSTSAAKTPSTWFKDDADLVVRQWFDHLGERFTVDLVKQCASVARTDAFCANWSQESAALDGRLQELDRRTAELQQAVGAAQTNPLRNDKLLEDLPKTVAGLQKDFAKFTADIEELPDRLESEQRAIVAARRQDDEILKRGLQLEPVEANALTAYLLRKQATRHLNQLVGWLRWARDVAPANGKSGPCVNRGEDILFAGCRPVPGILIRSLQLAGAARLGGQPVELRGTLMNVSSAPRLCDQPVRLRLVAAGSLPLELQATIDRTGPTARDELLANCRGILLPGLALGQADQLEMQLAPCIGSLSVSVVLEGEKLSGNIQIVQQKMQITPVVNGPCSMTLAAAMADSLGHVNSIATRLSLGGTLSEPTCTLGSNLGVAVAEALQRALQRAGDQHSRALLVKAGRQVDERLAEVDREVAEKQAHFASKTTDIKARLQKIAAADKPLYRISAEQGGRRLPNNSLFR